jgi:DNA invertase Pin-like site-specific DNA recombinase
MINTRTKAGIEQARRKGVKFGRRVGSKNKKTEYKLERIKIFLTAGKSYNWISTELSVSKKTIAKIKSSGANEILVV